MSVRVEVQPSVLEWARTRSGIDDDTWTTRFPRFEAWMAGEAAPTLKQLQEFARKTHTPVGFLFLDEPPVEAVPIPDLRTVGSRAVGMGQAVSADLLEVIHTCQARQEWYRDLVFVNGADSKAAQVFTLAHELAHLWLGETALSDLDSRSTDANAVERWCNQVAAELLVPIAEFRNVFDPARDLHGKLQASAERFWVSTQVILGRARQSGALTWDRYLQELEAERARVAALVAERGAGGNYYNTKPVQIGKRFARAIVASALEGQTSYTDAFRMLGLKKAATFDELAQRLGVL